MDEVFHLKAPFQPTGDQPQAIEALVQGINEGDEAQTLLGVTGSGKIMRAKAFKSHILSKKSTKRKRGFRQETEIAAADRKVIKSRLA